MGLVGSGLLRFVLAINHGFASGSAMAALIGGSIMTVRSRTMAGLVPVRYLWCVHEVSDPGNSSIFAMVAVRLKSHPNG